MAATALVTIVAVVVLLVVAWLLFKLAVGVLAALAEPTRLRIVDTVRKAAPEAVCQCELLPLFDLSQPALSKHLKVLIGAGILATERRGLWAYYYLVPDATEELRSWLS